MNPLIKQFTASPLNVSTSLPPKAGDKILYIHACFSIILDLIVFILVLNPVHGLPSACHQRSPFHNTDSHTTQTVIRHSGLRFPSSIALITHTHSCILSDMLYKPWTHLVIAALWNFSLVLFFPHSLRLCSLPWIFLSPWCLDSVCPCLDYYRVFG